MTTKDHAEGQVNYKYAFAVNCILTCIDAMMETPLHQRRVEDCTSGSHVGGEVVLTEENNPLMCAVRAETPLTPHSFHAVNGLCSSFTTECR